MRSSPSAECALSQYLFQAWPLLDARASATRPSAFDVPAKRVKRTIDLFVRLVEGLSFRHGRHSRPEVLPHSLDLMGAPVHRRTHQLQECARHVRLACAGRRQQVADVAETVVRDYTAWGEVKLGATLQRVFDEERQRFVDRLAAEELVTVLDLEIDAQVSPLLTRRHSQGWPGHRRGHPSFNRVLRNTLVNTMSRATQPVRDGGPAETPLLLSHSQLPASSASLTAAAYREEFFLPEPESPCLKFIG